MKVLIVTDLEGVSGITQWDKHEPRTPQDQWQRTLMTGEVNAAVAGAYDAGATRVKIAEGHNAIDILQMDERATLVPAEYPACPVTVSCGADGKVVETLLRPETSEIGVSDQHSRREAR